MRIEIPVKPLSINQAHKGMHYKTSAFHQYERDVCNLLPPKYKGHKHFLDTKDELFIKYVFYIKNYSKSDTGNFEKLITDLLVKNGYIKDDRFIKAMYLEKIKVKDIYEEKIVIDIVLYKNRMSLIK